MNFKAVALDLPGLCLIRPLRRHDSRGWFAEQFSAPEFAKLGIAFGPVQDNLSYSRAAGTIRGLHFQAPPSAQTKLVTVLSGSILDVVVDIRRDSPTYGQHIAVELSSEDGSLLLVPRGFAHGFCTLTENTLVHYKVDSPYDPSRDFGILWNDPDLGIDWPVSAVSAKVSVKDASLPRLSAMRVWFEHGGVE